MDSPSWSVLLPFLFLRPIPAICRCKFHGSRGPCSLQSPHRRLAAFSRPDLLSEGVFKCPGTFALRFDGAGLCISVKLRALLRPSVRSGWCDVCVCACVGLFSTLWSVTCQAPLSMEFSRQAYWSGLPFPSPENLSDPGIEPESPVSPALVSRFFTPQPPGKPVRSRDQQKILCSDASDNLYLHNSGQLS